MPYNPTAYPIFACSPYAETLIENRDGVPGDKPPLDPRTKYPFDLLNVAQSFVLPFEGTNEHSLRLSAHRRGKLKGRKFSVVKHRDYKIFEVARIG